MSDGPVCVCVCVCYGSGVRFPKQTMVVRSVVIVELATIVYGKRTEQASIILKKGWGSFGRTWQPLTHQRSL